MFIIAKLLNIYPRCVISRSGKAFTKFYPAPDYSGPYPYIIILQYVFIIIIPSTPRSPMAPLLSQFSNQMLYVFVISKECYKSHPYYCP